MTSESTTLPDAPAFDATLAPTGSLSLVDTAPPPTVSDQTSALAEYSPRVGREPTPAMIRDRAQASLDARTPPRPSWYPWSQDHGEEGVSFRPDVNLEEWKSRLSPEETARLKNDTTGDALRATLKREQDNWAYLDRTLQSGKTFDDALQSSFPFFSYAKDRGLLKQESPGLWKLATGLAGSLANGVWQWTTALNPMTEPISRIGAKARPGGGSPIDGPKRDSALADSTLFTSGSSLLGLYHGLETLREKAKVWAAEKIGMLSPDDAKFMRDWSDHTAYTVSSKAGAQQADTIKTLADYSGLSEKEVADAGVVGDLVINPINRLPLERAFAAAGGSFLRAGATTAARFSPGLTESLRVQLALAAKARAATEAVVAGVEEAGAGAGADPDHLAELTARLKALSAREADLRSLHAAAAGADAAAVEAVGRRSLARRAVGSAIAGGGWAAQQAGGVLGKIDGGLDRLASTVTADATLQPFMRTGLTAGAGAAVAAATEEDPVAGALVGAFAGGGIPARALIAGGRSAEVLGSLLRLGETTTPLARKVAQEVGGSSLPSFVADVLDPNARLLAFARPAKLAARTVVDVGARLGKAGLKGATEAAAIGAGFGYVQSGGEADAALDGAISNAPVGFLGGALGTLSPAFRARERVKLLESERQTLLRRWGLDQTNGAGNLARFKDLDPDQQLTVAHYAHARPDTAFLFTNRPEDRALIGQNTSASDAAIQQTAGLWFKDRSTGQSYVVLNPDQPASVFRTVLGHELVHEIESHPDIQAHVARNYLGDPATGTPGIFTRLDAAGNPIKITDAAGRVTFDVNDDFRAAKAEYLRRVRKTPGFADYDLADAAFAQEYEAEATAHRWIDGDFDAAIRPTATSVLWGKIEDSAFLRRVLGSFGVSFRSDLTVAGHDSAIGQIPFRPELKRLADHYTAAWARGERAPAVPKAPALDLTRHPAEAEFLRNSAELNRDPDGAMAGTAVDPATGRRVVRDPQQIWKTPAEVEATLAAQGRAVAETVQRHAEATAPEARAVRSRTDAAGREAVAGRYFTAAHLADLAHSGQFSAGQLETIRNVNSLLRDHPGNHVRFFHQETAGGADAAPTGRWREEMPFGWVASPDGGLAVRTVDYAQLARRGERLWATDPRAQALWANPTNLLADAWNHLRDRTESAEPAPTAKTAYLDRTLGLGAPASPGENPLFGARLAPELEPLIATRRLDRVNRAEPGPRSKNLPWSYDASSASEVKLRPADGEGEGPARELPESEAERLRRAAAREQDILRAKESRQDAKQRAEERAPFITTDPTGTMAIIAQSGRAAGEAPVSRAFSLDDEAHATLTSTPIVRDTLKLIDDVHGDGILPLITLVDLPPCGNQGGFNAEQKAIKLRSNTAWPRLVSAHEVGHLIDRFGLGDPSAFASEAYHPDIKRWWMVVKDSRSIMTIRSGRFDGQPIDNQAYLMRPREIWARSYAQYIAIRSGDPQMLRELDFYQKSPDYSFFQWSEADFLPIAHEMEKIFKQKGWRK